MYGTELKVKLTFNGQILKDEGKLEDYGIKDGDIIRALNHGFWFLHYLNATKFYPELISRNMSEELVTMLTENKE